MEVGGSQINAIELGGALRDRGHEVCVYSGEGALLGLVRRLRLTRVSARQGYHRPSPLTAAHLAFIAARGRFDVVHAHEWPPALEAYLATAFSRRRVAVVTVMSMAVAPFLPSSMSLVVGTERIRGDAARKRSGPTWLLEPPVDTCWNSPAGHDAGFRAEHALEGPLVVVVSRLVRELKLEGILTAVRAVGRLGQERQVRLVVVGDGPAVEEVRDEVARAGHGAVVLTGLVEDPRGAYESADVVIGMGGSALRGMAFAKPLVVQGERGFFRLLTPESTEEFLDHGWYGVGDGDLQAAEDALVGLLRELLEDPRRRDELGRYGRELLESRFGLQRAAAVQEGVYLQALQERPGPVLRVLDGARAAIGLVMHKAQRRRARRRGCLPTDDFNARPV